MFRISDIILFIPRLLMRWYSDYQDNQKWREFYAKLDRNKAGRFSKKQYMKDIKKVVALKKDEK